MRLLVNFFEKKTTVLGAIWCYAILRIMMYFQRDDFRIFLEGSIYTKVF